MQERSSGYGKLGRNVSGFAYRNANSVGGAMSNASQTLKEKIHSITPNENKLLVFSVQVPKVQGQLIALNPNDGSIEAVVGGDSFYQSKFNRALLRMETNQMNH